uniref:Uncharacterized protein n=1 Tax=uncultured prokaryote TaxID=198431 RepID=A0A0H5Q584_9ZZZZ|nr:hypothetical protein [uncultured prokaryote]
MVRGRKVKGQAYLLPDNLVPDDMFCAKVFIPDEKEYRQAFLGAYFYLSKWVAWERDSDNSAAVAASVWREAVELTLDSWGDGCGGIFGMDCEEIRACIDGLDLSGLVQVTNNISCGGDSFISIPIVGGEPVITPPPIGDEPPSPNIPLPDGVQIPDPVTVGEGDPPLGFDTWEDYDADACEAANALVEFSYQLSVRISGLLDSDLATVARLVVFLSSTFPVSWVGFFSSAMVLRLAEKAWSLARTEQLALLFGAIASYINANRKDLICELYERRGDAAGWENWLVGTLAQATGNLLEYANNYSAWLDLVTGAIPAGLGAQQVFGGVDFPSNANYIPCDCTQNDGVWVYVFSGDTQELNEGWNTQERLSFSAVCERNSSFSDGYIQAKLDIEPPILSPSTLTITLLQDDRDSGMTTLVCSLKSGVGIDQGSTDLQMGVNVIPIAVADVNRINIKSRAERSVSGPQNIAVDMTLDFTQQ